MGRKAKRLNLWVRRRSHLPVVLIGAVVVLLLFFNEETSITRTREFDSEIVKLKKEIKMATDSADFYRRSREALFSNKEDIERVARENYHMQRPTEDIYIVE